MDLGLSGRGVLVTGGSKGIGLAIAKELAAEGALVAICSRNADELRGAARQIGPDTVALPADVTEPAAVADLVSQVASRLGRLDILVNNAGGAHPGNFESLTEEDWRGDLDVKLFSQMRCFREALPHLRRSTAPRVVNINAIYAKQPDPDFFATTVIRAACLNLNKALAQEFGPEGILINSVNIGFVTTPQWHNIHRRRSPDSSYDDFTAKLAAAEVPVGRFGTVEEVSGLVAFLVSSRAGYITGASIDVSGGMGRYT
ncbi:MAG: SDR family oxidoreductase [Nocardioidaceae bacterium]